MNTCAVEMRPVVLKWVKKDSAKVHGLHKSKQCDKVRLNINNLVTLPKDSTIKNTRYLAYVAICEGQ